MFQRREGGKNKGTKGNEKKSQEGKKKKKERTENLLNERIGQRTKPTKTRVGSELRSQWERSVGFWEREESEKSSGRESSLLRSN